MTDLSDDRVTVRFAAKNLIAVAVALAVIGLFWAIVVPPLSGPQAYESFIAARADGVRCRLCGVPYSSAVLGVAVTLGSFTAMVVGGAAVAVARAFGPPALEIAGDGHGVYRLPWRERRFLIPAGARITVGPAFAFSPPATTTDGRPLRQLNLRTAATDLGAEEIRRRLTALRPDWTVE